MWTQCTHSTFLCTFWPWDKCEGIKDNEHDDLASVQGGCPPDHHEVHPLPHHSRGRRHCWHLHRLHGEAKYFLFSIVENKSLYWILTPLPAGTGLHSGSPPGVRAQPGRAGRDHGERSLPTSRERRRVRGAVAQLLGVHRCRPLASLLLTWGTYIDLIDVFFRWEEHFTQEDVTKAVDNILTNFFYKCVDVPWLLQADWMCAGICKAPEDHAMTCEECQTGIMKSQEQLLNPKTIDYLVEQLTPIICASNEDERCPRVVDTVIRQGLPLLAAEGDTSEIPEVGQISFLWLLIISFGPDLQRRCAGNLPREERIFPKHSKTLKTTLVRLEIESRHVCCCCFTLEMENDSFPRSSILQESIWRRWGITFLEWNMYSIRCM